ncbi:MAG: tyrosine--tRNA ligase [Spirochaetaceae bacterium]|jgi:tyrosyl-tRNA synthetase|nr:tyrosine--tRNA ligase [Spirochaetaceae bacterium]
MNSTLNTLKTRGFIAQCTDINGLSDLMDSDPITFYVGCDPTGKSLHIGHIVPFFAFRHLRAAGHRGIALIGGGTARIGDPSGKTEMRKILDYSQLDGNAAAIQTQLQRFLEDSDGKITLYENNKDWLAELNYIDFLREIGSHFSVNRMLGFEAYKKRLETGLSFIEFNYQLLQSYDFLQLYKKHGCRLQIGGDDQWGNIVAGIELIRRLYADGQPKNAQAFGLTFPLLETSSGAKMGKTEKGALFLDPLLCSPYDFFQYWRNISDSDLRRFLLIFTFLPVEECERLASLKNPNEGKERLAWEVTALIHGKDEAGHALAGAHAAFCTDGNREALPSKKLQIEKLSAGYNIVDLFYDAGLCSTKSEARRLVEQGGAFITQNNELQPQSDISALIGKDSLNEYGELVIRAGKKRVLRILF